MEKFFSFNEWVTLRSFKKICHPLGDVTYYLGYLFVESHRPSSKGLLPIEHFPVEGGSMALPARYPGELTWEDELRLLFPVFLEMNPRTYYNTGRGRVIIPYVTLMHASKINPYLFMSLVLQRAYDKEMKWPGLEEMTDPSSENNWRLCNYVKFPPLRQNYPVSSTKLVDLRDKMKPFRGRLLALAENMDDLLPDDLSPADRENLRLCDRIDSAFRAEKLLFVRHLL